MTSFSYEQTFPEASASPTFGQPTGDAACSERGCTNSETFRCNYVDSRARSCRTHWCAEHSRAVGGLRYCRRHAGTMSALGSKANNPRALPDVDHRGASLVRWVHRDLDKPLGALLERSARPEESVLRDLEVAVMRDEQNARRWEMSWKLADHTGVTMKITVAVQEDDDAVVYIRLGNETVAKGVPPWIERRRRGQTVPPEADQAQRELFYSFLEEYLTKAVSQLRPAVAR